MSQAARGQKDSTKIPWNAILQCVMSRPFLLEDELKKLLSPYKMTIDNFFQTANEKLHPIGFEMRFAFMTRRKEDIKLYGVCPIYKDQNVKESLDLRPQVIQHFFRILQMVLESEDGIKTRYSAAEIIEKRPEGVQQKAAQDGINQLVELTFLDYENDEISLGPRSILEFQAQFN